MSPYLWHLNLPLIFCRGLCLHCSYSGVFFLDFLILKSVRYHRIWSKTCTYIQKLKLPIIYMEGVNKCYCANITDQFSTKVSSITWWLKLVSIKESWFKSLLSILRVFKSFVSLYFLNKCKLYSNDVGSCVDTLTKLNGFFL